MEWSDWATTIVAGIKYCFPCQARRVCTNNDTSINVRIDHPHDRLLIAASMHGDFWTVLPISLQSRAGMQWLDLEIIIRINNKIIAMSCENEGVIRLVR